MTLSSAAALFGAMAVLAAMPSISVLTVSARSASAGFAHGVSASLGIVAGDIIFILIAIFGLSLLADTSGELFIVVKYLGGAYLIVLGTLLWRSGGWVAEPRAPVRSSLSSSFLAGLTITLADQKAILFYLGFFPAFLDLSAISIVDTGIIIAVTITAVGGVKIAYAWLADRSRSLVSTAIGRWINVFAGCVMVVVGVFVVING